MNHAERVVTVIGHHDAGMLIQVEQGHDFLRRFAEIHMLHVVAGGHDAAYRALAHTEYPRNHHPLLLIENRLTFNIVGHQRRGLRVQFGRFMISA